MRILFIGRPVHIFVPLALSCVPALNACAGISICADREDALYAAGTSAEFTVHVTDEKGASVPSGRARWILDNFGTKTVGRGEADLAEGNPFHVRGALAEDGFLRLKVNAGTNRAVFSVGYDVGKIRQTAARPADFDAYWQGEMARLRREVPLAPMCVPAIWLPKREGYDVFRISFSTFGDRRVWGFMSVPTDRSKAPFRARIRVCDAGNGAYEPWEANGDEVTVTMNVHYFEPGKTRAEQAALIRKLADEMAARYNRPGFTYRNAGMGGARGDCYFHDAMLGIARAIDWIAERQEVDAKRIVYYGSSQGGGVGLFVNYLNPRFARACFAVPALTGHLAGLQDRQAGWPFYVSQAKKDERERVLANVPYYDGVNFAAGIRHPVRFVVSLADECCPPPDVYAAYNVCPAKDKAIVNCIGAGHDGHGQWIRENRGKPSWIDVNAWLREGPGCAR